MNKLNLGKDNINKLLLSFSIPCVISMLINSIYNIVDQIFIGKGVGTLGNGATNVIFPLIIIFNAFSSLLGNGAAANLSLKLGEGKKDEGAKSVGQAIVVTAFISITLAILSYIFLPKLVYLFGCTKSVYPYAIDYGRIIIIGSPFVIMYSSLSNIIRADGSPKYSMIMLVVGAIINIFLDYLFINVFDMGVKGGALATIIGQFISFLFAMMYLRKFKSVKLTRKDFKIDKNVFRIMSLGASSFITQCTVLVLFVFMNNVMTKLGVNSKFGADIPLAVYGVMSKVNSLFISTVLGISIGAQPIVGFNYGAGNELRVKETLRKVLTINFTVGFMFNLVFFLFPRTLAGMFIAKGADNYELFMQFAELLCHSFLAVMFLNALEMTSSILIQSLGKVKKATALSFIRQILLFLPISILLGFVLNKGIYGVLYAGLIADSICFVIAIFIFLSEYTKLGKNKDEEFNEVNVEHIEYSGKHQVITIAREYASGGRYVGKILASELGINFYDKEIISLASLESGLSKKYINDIDEKKRTGENDDRLFIAESKTIKNIAKNESCVIVGRCADYVLKDNKDILKVFIYSSDEDKVKRAVKYYGLDKEKALKEINKINKNRSKHYEYYTNRKWMDMSNYDLLIDVSKFGVEGAVSIIKKVIENNND